MCAHTRPSPHNNNKNEQWQVISLVLWLTFSWLRVIFFASVVPLQTFPASVQLINSELHLKTVQETADRGAESGMGEKCLKEPGGAGRAATIYRGKKSF